MALVVAQQRELLLLELLADAESAGAEVTGAGDVGADLLERAMKLMVLLEQLGGPENPGAVEDVRGLIGGLGELLDGRQRVGGSSHVGVGIGSGQ